MYGTADKCVRNFSSKPEIADRDLQWEDTTETDVEMTGQADVERTTGPSEHCNKLSGSMTGRALVN